MQTNIILLCGLFFFLLQQTNKEESFTWNESHKLTWADFKSQPDVSRDAVALTASGITFGYSLKTFEDRIIGFTTSVEAHFYPNKSWYKKGKANDITLKHEQLHFDITELYARMFREQLSKISVNQNIALQLNTLNNSINEIHNATQKKYDAESKHSTDIAKQKQWEVFIAAELKKLDQYKSK